MTQFVEPNHPSYGCKQAWFLFGIMTAAGTAGKILLVEAKNPWAVQTIEAILSRDGKVSANCAILMAHRDCESIGIRAEIVQEVSWVDFMLDIVEPGRILDSAVVAVAFRNSLTDEEQLYASRKMSAVPIARRESARLRAVKAVAPPKPVPVPKPGLPSPPAPVVSEDRTKLIGGLVSLGFKKQVVQKFVDGLGSRVGQEKLADLIRLGIQELAA